MCPPFTPFKLLTTRSPLLLRAIAKIEVDQPHDGRGGNHPEELVPVKEGKSPERGVIPSVEGGEAEPEVGEQERKHPHFLTPSHRVFAGIGHRVEHSGFLLTMERLNIR